ALAETPGSEQLTLKAVEPRPRDLRASVEGDFVHIHGVWTPMLAMAARACAGRGTPYCVAPHGMLDPWCLTQKRAKKMIALALIWKRILNRAAFIHALNRDEAELM